MAGSRWRMAAFSVLLLIGCARTMKPPEVPTQQPPAVLEMARARAVPDPLRARFNVRIRSRALDVAGSTHGVLIVDRPGKGHIAIMGPLGGPLFTLSSDAVGVAAVLPRDRRHLAAVDAQSVLQDTVPGLAELDDLFGLLVGDVPLDEERVRQVQRLDDERVVVVLDGPDGVLIAVTLWTATATPSGIVAQRSGGERLMAVTFAPFQEAEGALMPTDVALEVPSLDLRVDLSYRSWRVLDTVPDVFGLDTPAGYTTESLERFLQDLASRTLQGAATGGPPPAGALDPGPGAAP